jgi:hypothetical protein
VIGHQRIAAAARLREHAVQIEAGAGTELLGVGVDVIVLVV